MRYAFVLVIALALLQTGCEEDVVAVTGTDIPFSVFGALTPQADTQWVRVYPVEGRLEPAGREPLDAVVTSRAEQAGTMQTWSDSLIRDPGRLFAHVFWHPFAVEHGELYSLVVRRSDGEASRVSVRVPDEATLVMPPPANVAPSRLRAFVAGDVPNLIRIEVTYQYRYITPGGVESGQTVFQYDDQKRRVDGGWIIDLMPAPDLRGLQNELAEYIPLDPTIGLRLTRLILRLIVANAEWEPPGGVFDPEVLVQPGNMNNVENGFGFLGAGYRLSATWIPRDTLIVVG